MTREHVEEMIHRFVAEAGMNRDQVYNPEKKPGIGPEDQLKLKFLSRK